MTPDMFASALAEFVSEFDFVDCLNVMCLEDDNIVYWFRRD